MCDSFLGPLPRDQAPQRVVTVAPIDPDDSAQYRPIFDTLTPLAASIHSALSLASTLLKESADRAVTAKSDSAVFYPKSTSALKTAFVSALDL